MVPTLIVNSELALSLVLRASSCGVEKKVWCESNELGVKFLHPSKMSVRIVPAAQAT